MARSKEKIHFFKVDMGDFYWYLMSLVPISKWRQGTSLYAVCKIVHNGLLAHENFPAYAWRYERERKAIEKISALEVLVIFGLTPDVIRERIKSRYRNRGGG